MLAPREGVWGQAQGVARAKLCVRVSDRVDGSVSNGVSDRVDGSAVLSFFMGGFVVVVTTVLSVGTSVAHRIFSRRAMIVSSALSAGTLARHISLRSV